MIALLHGLIALSFAGDPTPEAPADVWVPVDITAALVEAGWKLDGRKVQVEAPEPATIEEFFGSVSINAGPVKMELSGPGETSWTKVQEAMKKGAEGGKWKIVDSSDTHVVVQKAEGGEWPFMAYAEAKMPGEVTVCAKTGGLKTQEQADLTIRACRSLAFTPEL